MMAGRAPTPTVAAVSEYEQERLARIKENQRKLRQLGLAASVLDESHQNGGEGAQDELFPISNRKQKRRFPSGPPGKKVGSASPPGGKRPRSSKNTRRRGEDTSEYVSRRRSARLRDKKRVSYDERGTDDGNGRRRPHRPQGGAGGDRNRRSDHPSKNVTLHSTINSSNASVGPGCDNIISSTSIPVIVKRTTTSAGRRILASSSSSSSPPRRPPRSPRSTILACVISGSHQGESDHRPSHSAHRGSS